MAISELPAIGQQARVEPSGRCDLPSRVFGYAAMALGIVAIGLPLAWLLSAALKENREIYVYPTPWIPAHPTLGNFRRAWESAPFARYYLNSLVVTTVVVLGKLVNAVFSAYALAHLRFPRKDIVFLAVLAALMVPPEVTVLPNYLLVARLGWVNTLQALIVPSLGVAVGTFLLRQAFLSLPGEVLDAARVDGAGHLRLIWDILLPLARPVLVTFALLATEGKWNESLWPMIVTSRAEMRTLPIGVFWLLDQEGNTEWGVVMAGTIFVVLPILAMFIWAQRHVVEGIAAGAVKG